MPAARDIRSKLERLGKDCERLEAYRQLSLNEFLEEPSILNDTCYLIFTTFQSALDIGTELLNALGMPEPPNETDAFALLVEKEVLSQVCVSQLTAMQGLCDSLSEQYEDIDPQWVYQALQVNLAGLNQFVQQIRSFLDQ